ncbi:hypothetical protein TWF192_002826 [Orbilia oligospora]|nr:hypothetical protein TWF192_002826 [Orbilia oligospora]
MYRCTKVKRLEQSSSDATRGVYIVLSPGSRFPTGVLFYIEPSTAQGKLKFSRACSIDVVALPSSGEKQAVDTITSVYRPRNYQNKIPIRWILPQPKGPKGQTRVSYIVDSSVESWKAVNQSGGSME